MENPIVQSMERTEADQVVFVGCPSEDFPEPTPESIAMDVAMDVATVSEATAREALLNLAKKDCCWSKGPATKCEILSRIAIASFHLKLETFQETRGSHEAHDRNINSHHPGGQEPGIWSMPVVHPPHFQDTVAVHDIPFTSHVRTCFCCNGSGKVKCQPCHGSGRTACVRCGGDGKISHTTHKDGKTETTQSNCGTCHASGKVSCSRCHGSGNVTCGECGGPGKLRHWKKMTVTHKTVVHEQMVDKIDDKDLPPALLEEAPGRTVISHQAHGLAALTGLMPDLCAASVEETGKARQHMLGSGGVQHQQRLTVRCIPVTACRAKYGSAEFGFWVYGDDNRCNSPEYPSKCCGCCVDLCTIA